MKVLIYGNRKQDDEIYDISTPEKEAAAYLLLFRLLDEQWEVYCDLPANQKSRYEKAKAGNADAAKRLLNARKDYEYEEFHFGEVIDPLKEGA
jgi:hypothetical protein